MPRFDKTCVTQFANTGCEKQLRFSLHPDVIRHRPERAVLNLPHPQIRPALAEIRNAGNEWGYSKVHELSAAFGPDRLVGGSRTPTGGAASPGLRFADSELLTWLQPGAEPGSFLIETEFDAGTPTFLTAHRLSGLVAHGTTGLLEFARVRPDVIEVLAPGQAGAAQQVVTAAGDLEPVADGDRRLQLRIIDVKLTSEPGPHYFAELAYYAVTLAAWLQDHDLDQRYTVSADPAVWPGSETAGNLAKAIADGVPDMARYQALHDDLETAPLRIFLADLARLLHDVLPRVLDAPYDQLPWAVTPGCQGCENLGQKFTPTPGTNASDWDPRHCLPTAEATQDLSRLPFVSRGAIRVLRERGHGDVPAVAALPDTDATFDSHHRLRGQRAVISARARALTGVPTAALASGTATTAAIPRFAKLHLYLTADFDPGSAITLAFGLRWAWLDRITRLTRVAKTRVHYVPAKTVEDEWRVFALLLDDMDALLSEASSLDPRADVQAYVWDTVTFEHLTRVVGRHLGHIMATRRLSRLAWLFPPEEVLEAPHLASSPAVSVVRDAVRGLLSLDAAHTYTLLETARRYYGAGYPNTDFWVPRFWSDPFTDQIPPERAHQLWRGRMTPNAPTATQLQSDLHRTVTTKLNALSTITDRLGQDLRDRIPRTAPRISQLRGPTDVTGTSHLGLLLYTHAKLNAALSELEVSRTRALTVTEREATFASARLTRKLTGDEAAAALAELGLDPGPNRAVYEIAPGSREVKARVGDFSWAIAPEASVSFLEQSFAAVIRRNSTLENRWGGNWAALQQKMTKVLGVAIAGLDRDRRLLVVDFESWGDATPLRQDLLGAGLVQLGANLVMDPVAVDVFTRKVEDTVKAIRNPPAAARDPRIQNALGITRNPRQTSPHPAGDFLWDALTTSLTRVPRPTDAIRARLETLGYALNPSQWAAWKQALSRRIALIWGPPGTGKTATVRAVLAGLAEDSTVSGKPLRVAVAAGTYTAVDNILSDLQPRLTDNWPGTEVRRLRSHGRQAPDWLPASWDVDTSDTGQLQDAAVTLAGPGTIIVGGTTEQLYRLIDHAAGTAGPLFDVIVLDEAGQLDVAHATLVLAGAAPAASLVVAGDPRQLPPIHAADPPAGLESLVGSVYGFFRDWHQIPDSPLTVNYRSNSDIVALARRAGYPSDLTAYHPGLRLRYAPGKPNELVQPPDWPSGLPFSPDLADIARPDRPVVCLTYPEGVSGQWNQFEADTVTALVRWYSTRLADGLDGQSGPAGQAPPGAAPTEPRQLWQRIGIVTPHRAQRARVIERLAGVFATPDADPATSSWIAGAVDTVERFQGQERDIIIASYAVGDPDTVAEEAEFLHNMNRFNVLATRAKAKLIVIASRELVAHISGDLQVIRSSELLKDFVDSFCSNSRPATLDWIDADLSRPVEVELRWH